MPVFDFNSTPDENKKGEVTYTTFASSESIASKEHPIMFWIIRIVSGSIIPVVCSQILSKNFF